MRGLRNLKNFGQRALRNAKFGVKGPTEPFDLNLKSGRISNTWGSKGPPKRSFRGQRTLRNAKFRVKYGKLSHRGESSKRTQEFFSDRPRGLAQPVTGEHTSSSSSGARAGANAVRWTEDAVRVDRASSMLEVRTEFEVDRRTRSAGSSGRSRDDLRELARAWVPYAIRSPDRASRARADPPRSRRSGE
jgi:hypothetical protein